MSFQTDNLLLHNNTKIFSSSNNVYVTDQSTYTGCLNSWVLTGTNNINFSLGGNVGINTQMPATTLDIAGTFKNTQGTIFCSEQISRKLYSYIATGTSSTNINITLTFTNENFIAKVKGLAFKNGLSMLETNCFGGTLDNSLPSYPIVATDILINASTGATYIWNSSISTTTNTVVLSLPSSLTSIAMKLAIECIDGTLSSITNTCDIPTTVVYTY